MGSLEQLQHAMHESAAEAKGRHGRHEAALQQLQRSGSHDMAQVRSALAELQAMQAEQALKQRNVADDLTATSSTVSVARRELGDLAHLVQRLEERVVTWRGEILSETSSELRQALAQKGAEGDGDRRRVERDVSGLVEARVESLRQELSALARSHSDTDTRSREALRRFEMSQGQTAKDLEALQAELHEHAEQTRRGDQRFAGLLESQEQLHRLTQTSHESLREELAAAQHQLSAGLRAEARALAKNEQVTVAALDEQLWLTDQRLSQRIDELAHAHERTVVAAAAASSAASMAHEAAQRSRSQDLLGMPGSCSKLPSMHRGLSASFDAVEEPSSTRASPSRSPVRTRQQLGLRERALPPPPHGAAEGPGPATNTPQPQRSGRQRSGRGLRKTSLSLPKTGDEEFGSTSKSGNRSARLPEPPDVQLADSIASEPPPEAQCRPRFAALVEAGVEASQFDTQLSSKCSSPVAFDDRQARFLSPGRFGP